MEFTLLWAALTGVLFAWIGTRLWPDDLPDHPLDRMLGAGAAGLVVGRIVAMIVQGTNPITHPGDILIVRGGVHTGAAVIGAMAAYLWSVHGRIAAMDATAAAALLGISGWHAGCLWRGTCLGTASDLPWAWSVSGGVVDRHPVEIYAALAMFGAAFIVARLPRRPLLASGAALAAASLIRLLTQPMRLTVDGGPTGWYLAGVLVGMALPLLGWLVTEQRRRARAVP
ncbi:MAG: prolipoprotein diacylglyceryl transferase family protein [Acidimicrobiia bacterium]